MKIKPIFAWYDLWVGLFWNAKKRAIYVFPVPMLGFVAHFWTRHCYVMRGGGVGGFRGTDGPVNRDGARGSFVMADGGWSKNVFDAHRYTISEARALEYMTRTHGKSALSFHHVRDFIP